MKNPQPNRIASAYRFAERIVLHSQGRTPAGFYIGCEPYLTLPVNATNVDIGRAVESVLDGYRAEVPQPTDWKQVTAAFISGIGAKSNRQLQQTSVCCGIREQEGRLVFEPSHNGGTSGDAKGFQPITSARFSVPAHADAAETGAALVRGFDLALQFMAVLSHCVQATPDCALLFILAQVSGAPDAERSVAGPRGL